MNRRIQSNCEFKTQYIMHYALYVRKLNECRQRLDPQTLGNLAGRTSNEKDTTAWQRQGNVTCLNSQALCGLNPWDTNPSREDRVLGNPDSMGHDKDGFVSMQDTHILCNTIAIRCVVQSRTEVVFRLQETRWRIKHPIQPPSSCHQTPSSCHQIPPHLFPPDAILPSSPNHLHCTFSTIAPMMSALPPFPSLCLRNRENKLFFSRTNSYLNLVLQREHSVKNALCALIEIISRRRVREVLLVIFHVGEPLSITKKANKIHLISENRCLVAVITVGVFTCSNLHQSVFRLGRFPGPKGPGQKWGPFKATGVASFLRKFKSLHLKNWFNLV